MLALKEFRPKTRSVSSLLKYAALWDSGIVKNKDGSLTAGWFYRGRDLGSSTNAELATVSARVNAALRRLGAGWCTHTDAVRLETASYMPRSMSQFPDPITQLIENERRSQFESLTGNYESVYALTVTYLPPSQREAKAGNMMLTRTGGEDTKQATPEERVIAQFKTRLKEIEDSVGDAIKLKRMGAYTAKDDTGTEHLRDELVDYLAFCLNGRESPRNIPPVPMYMSGWLGTSDLHIGSPYLYADGQYIALLSIDGFPSESEPVILSALDQLPQAYRWNTRFIFMDQHEADAHLKSLRRKWKQRERGLISQIFQTAGGAVNLDAVMMTNEAEAALADNSGGVVTFGYYSSVVVVRDSDQARLEESLRELRRTIERAGFGARIEELNAVEAFLGSLPGHAEQNIRRPPMHTLTLADLMPLSAVWPGLSNNPCRFYPQPAPPLMYASTTGSTPFRLNLHVADVGHTLIFGPTGSGKSTLLATIAAQFRRYPRAKITSFDKGRSLLALTLAVGGRHVELAPEDSRLTPKFCPLQELETDSDVAWALEWLETCVLLQRGEGSIVTPAERDAMYRALRNLARPGQPRSLTHFCSEVQNTSIREALKAYTLEGAMGFMLDQEESLELDDTWQVFELDDLMDLGEKAVIPVLLYLFRRFEKGLDGRPSLLLLDEAWIMLGHAVFREKIREWLKVLRRANCAVVLATQSLSDAVRSGILDVLQESCPTKILLPNEEADKMGANGVLGPRDLYSLFGLNDTEIEVLRYATKKRHYYYTSTEGRRLFDLNLGPVALAFVSASGREEIAEVRGLAERYGERWPYVWLQQRGVNYAHLQQ